MQRHVWARGCDLPCSPRPPGWEDRRGGTTLTPAPPPLPISFQLAEGCCFPAQPGKGSGQDGLQAGAAGRKRPGEGPSRATHVPSAAAPSPPHVQGWQSALGTGQFGECCGTGSHTTRQASPVFPNPWGQPAQGGPYPTTAGESKSEQEKKKNIFFSSFFTYYIGP